MSPQSVPEAPRKRDDRPKTNLNDDLGYRISGLEKAKLEPSMTRADIAALDRAIAKLRQKKAEKTPKPENEVVE